MTNNNKAYTLREYIKKEFVGNQADFARDLDVAPSQITQWINKGFVVVNHTLYSPRRELKQKE